MSSAAGIWPKVSSCVGAWLFAGSGLAVIALFVFFDRLPVPNRLDDMLPALGVACGSRGRNPPEALSLFAAQSRWMAFALLLTTVAAIAFVVAVVTLIAIARDVPQPAHPESDRRATVVVGIVGLVLTCLHVYRLNQGDSSGTGFLTTLLGTVSRPADGCGSIRDMVWPMRTVGEGTAVMLAAAMAATATRSTDPETVARRIGTLQVLLYCGSLLFVAGILASQSNFAWVTAQWGSYPREEGFGKLIDAIVEAGTLQAGVGYSALLVIFFLPARSYLAWRARTVAPRAELHDRAKEKKDMEDAGLVGSWRDDVKQIVALLAPILSAPLFDALAK